MAKKSGLAWLIGLGVFGVLGLSGDSSQEPSPAIPKPKPDGDAGVVTRHAAAFKQALKAFVAQGQAKLKEDAARKDEQKESGKAAAALTSAAGALAANIPTIGPVIALAAQLFALMFKELGYGAYLPNVDGRVFTGWRSDCYYFKEVPVYGPAWDELRGSLEPLSTRGNPAPLSALGACAREYPNGPPAVEVQISDTGDYFYLFNPTKPGDLSEAARAQNRVFGMVVFSPADITPTGPRDFDPSSPMSWKVPRERRSKLDTILLDPVKDTGM